MASYFDQISSLNPKIWYRFNETAGNSNNSGSLTSTLTPSFPFLLNEQTDVDGRAIYINGQRGELSQMPEFSLFDDREFTIETWFKTNQAFLNDKTSAALWYFRGRTTNLNVSSSTQIVEFKLNIFGGAYSIVNDRYKINFTSNISGPGSNVISNSINIADDKWHHAVAVVNTTSLKFYLDGQLVGSVTPTNMPARFYIDNSASHFSTNRKQIGTDSVAQSTDYKGWIDEFAAYGYELSAAQVLANFNAGASVNFPANVVGTASALMVQPLLYQDTLLAADPMTASSDGAGHAASTVNFPTMLEAYMAGRTLETWYKFNIAQQLTNYGSLPTKVSIFEVDASTVPGVGIQGSGALLTTGGTNGGVLNLSDNVGPLIADKDFSFGFWVKKSTNETAQIVGFYDSGTSGDQIEVFWNSNGSITTNGIFNNNHHDIVSSTDYADGNWHYVAVRQSGNDLQMWIDNTSIGTQTITHSYSAIDYVSFGNGNQTRTEKMYISQFYVATAANITSTEIGNIYTAGTSAETQASAYMPEAKAKFNSAFNDYIVTKNPLLDFRLDEGSGAPLDYGSAGLVVVSQQSPQGYTQNETALNTRGFKFTDRLQAIRGNYALATGTVSSANECTIGILFKNANATNQQGLVGFGGRGGTQGTGFSLQQLASSGYLRIIAGSSNGTTTSFTGTKNVGDNKWHLAVIVKEASTIKLYLDGQLDISSSSSHTLTDSGEFSIAAISGIDAATASRNTLIDEIFVTAGAFSAQEVFEAWRSLRLEMDTTASASLPMPTNIAGTGYTDTPAVFTASALFEIPANSTDQVPTINPGTASALFVLPNFGGNVVIDANYGHTAATADALFHDPQFQIGDFHAADHMNASALMVQPIISANGAIVVSTAVTGDAIFVMPGIVTIKGARVFAQPALANAFLPLPPAYLQLTDDQWYVRLFAQHATQNIEPKFNTVTGQPATQIAKTVLKFFDDVTSSITVGNGYLENDLQEKIFEAPGSTNTTKTKIYPSIAANTTPTPALYEGYFDDFGRKAVRVNNIEFEMPEEIYNSQLPFSLEFSIKTTKANQIIAKGKWKSFLYTQKSETGFGLYDGKLYMMTSNTTSGVPGNRTPHPANPDMAGNPYMIGRKNIADGQWHHIIVQYGFTDNRIQFWVDGQLDRQLIEPGLRNARLYIMGSNNAITAYQSDFETSAWSYDKQAFISEQDVSLNYIGYLKYEPIKAEPMKATITMTANNTATGNRGRAIVFYFWPENTDGKIAKNPLEITNPGGPTFDPVVSTDDYFRQPPQQWYDWDLYPVDVTGRYVSELVKPEAYGVENIKIQEPSFTILTGRENPAQFAYKVNTRGYFTDPVTDARRYIDVFNDIDLSQFDAIFFKNYPEESIERDAYTREDFADEYFNLRERELFDKFIQSLRKAIDTGISLFITNHQLAVDLGIVDRVEDVTNIYEGDFSVTDPYVAARVQPNGAILPRTAGDYLDLHKNNRFKVINTLENLTNEAGYIWKDWFYFENDDTVDYGGPNRPYTKIEYRPNGLQVGDEFIISDETLRASYSKATPIANVKAGKVITTFADQIYQNNTLVDNPFKNYATTIAVEPGTILNGKPTVGKIFVAFTEGFSREGRDYTREYFGVDLIQDEFINKAYQDGEITLAKRDELLASTDNLDRRLEAAIAANNQNLVNEINKLKYWTSNGDYILTQKTLLDDPTGSGVQQDGLGKGVRKGRVNRVNKKGALSTQSISSSLQWFALTYAYQFERAQFAAVSMLTRGIRWLSDKIIDDGLVIRTEVAKNLTANLPMPVVTADKDRTVYAQAMFALGNIITATGYSLANVSNTSLPLFADAKFGDFVKNIKPDVFTASAVARQPRISGIQEDEIVVYIMHVDPILYLREEVIK